MASTNETLSESTVGDEYGHVPGNQYRDVTVTIGQRGDMYRATVLEVWGSNQVSLEEHGRKIVSARSDDWEVALADAERRARDVGITTEYLVQATSAAEDGMPE